MAAHSPSQASSFTLRPPERGDSAVLLEGRNSPRVHPFLFSDHAITPQEHQSWLEKRLAPGWDRPIFMFLGDGKPLGMVNLTHFDPEHGRGEWGFYLWATNAPKGAGTCMLGAFLDELFLRRGLRKLCALVLCSNEKSLHLHQKLGFTQEGRLRGHVVKHGVAEDVAAFALFDGEWKSKREAFAEPIRKVTLL